MRKVFFAIILFTCFLIGCSKEYEINVIVDNETLTYNISDIYFNVDDIEIKENYEYLDLYLDSNYQNKFDGIVNDNLTLYLKYNKYYNVTVKINNDIEKQFKILENDFFDESKITLKSNEKLVGLYYDNDYINKYNQEIVSNDLTLYAFIKKKVNVNIYDEDKFITSKEILEGDKIVLPSYDFNPRYQNIKYYFDKDYKIEYNDKLESLNLYINYDLDLTLNDKVFLLINGDDFVISYQINKGETLKDKDIIKLLDGKIGYSANYHLFLDPFFTKSFNYGPIYEDVILYVKTYDEMDFDLCVTVEYNVSDSKQYPIQSNTVFNVYSLDVIPDKYFIGLYWDKSYTREYNDELIDSDTKLYALYQETPKDNVTYHKVEVYISDACLGLDEIKKQEEYTLWYTYYIEDGKYIPNLSFRNPYYPKMIIHAFYKDNYNVAYYEDIITDDLQLYCIYNEHVSYVSEIIIEQEEVVIDNKVITYYKAK